ncbi:opticin isoform X2 [Mustela erminea]|uniref:opticin isoform X2 n=1 Tax=Mustela erminea TaxID=36723 RepID=UPI001386C677|nr:opticin isoform X2 [Mustela erminea]
MAKGQTAALPPAHSAGLDSEMIQLLPYFSGRLLPGTPMKRTAFLSLLALVLLGTGTASLPTGRKRRDPAGESDAYGLLGNYVLGLDNYDEVIDLSNYEGLTDYGDQLPEVKGSSPAPPTRVSSAQSTVTPRSLSSKPPMNRLTTLGFLDSPGSHDLPTCLVCVCLGSSVYCDDADLESIPPLPKTTAYLYARFNRIREIRAGDFKGLTKLKRINLSSNSISSIDDDALRLLPELQDLILPENQLGALPALPTSLEVLDVRQNRLRSSGIQPGAFKNNMIETMQSDAFCDTEEHKHSRRRLEDIRLDGNPINLGLFPSAYFCLPRLPTGRCC